MAAARAVLLAAILSLCAAVDATGEARLALPIGNEAYSAKVGALKNPLHDIDLVGAALAKLGFEVTTLGNATKAQMDEAIRRYVDRVRRAGPKAIGFFYYSGHGAVNPETNVNYLIPVDLDSADSDDLWYRSIEQPAVIDLLSQRAKNATHFVVFDACRNELNLGPAEQKSLGGDKGFVPVNDVSGILIAYATAQKRTAADTGAFARILSEELVKPGAEAVSVFREVQLRVTDTMQQEPWMSLNYIPRIYLASQPKPVETAPVRPLPQSPLGEAAETWKQIKDLKDPGVFEAFRKQYGAINPVYGALAARRLADLERLQTPSAKPESTDSLVVPSADADSPRHLMRVFTGHAGFIRPAVFSPDGKLAVSGDMGGTVKVWDLATGFEAQSLTAHKRGITAIAFAPDGRTFVTAGEEGDLKTWDRANGKPVSAVYSAMTVSSLAVFPDGRILAGGCEKEAGEWGYCKSERAFLKIFTPGSLAASTFIEVGKKLNSLALSPDYKLVLSCGDKIQLWDLAAGTKLRSLSEGGPYCNSIQLSKDGRSAIAGGAWGYLKLFLVDIATGRELRSFAGEEISILGVAISPDGRFVLSASGGTNRMDRSKAERRIGQAILWDAVSGRKIAMLEEGSDDMWAVAFSPDGHYALTAGRARAVNLWDVSDWTQSHAAAR